MEKFLWSDSNTQTSKERSSSSAIRCKFLGKPWVGNKYWWGGNVIIRKPATPHGNRKTLFFRDISIWSLQKNSDKVHDFEKDLLMHLVDGEGWGQKELPWELIMGWALLHNGHFSNPKISHTDCWALSPVRRNRDDCAFGLKSGPWRENTDESWFGNRSEYHRLCRWHQCQH